MSLSTISLKDRTFNQVKVLTGRAGFCSYNNEDLASMLGTSERHVRRMLRSLEDEGRIFRTHIWIGNFEYGGEYFKCPKLGRRIYVDRDKFSKDVDVLHWQEKIYHRDKIKKSREALIAQIERDLKIRIQEDIFPSSSQSKKEATGGHGWSPETPRGFKKYSSVAREESNSIRKGRKETAPEVPGIIQKTIEYLEKRHWGYGITGIDRLGRSNVILSSYFHASTTTILWNDAHLTIKCKQFVKVVEEEYNKRMALKI